MVPSRLCAIVVPDRCSVTEWASNRLSDVGDLGFEHPCFGLIQELDYARQGRARALFLQLAGERSPKPAVQDADVRKVGANALLRLIEPGSDGSYSSTRLVESAKTSQQFGLRPRPSR